MPKTPVLVVLVERIWRTFTSIDRSSIILTSYLYRESVRGWGFLYALLMDTVSFIHITDPYASDIPDTHVQQMTMSMPPPPPLPHLPPEQNYGPEYTLAGIDDHVTSHPQYADVAASSLKAMIDPNLEANTRAVMADGHDPPGQSGYVHSGTEEQHEHELLATTLQQEVANEDQFLKNEDSMQEENINETIMKALQNTESQVKSM